MKRQVNPEHYAIYHLHVIEGQRPRETARALGVNLASVYLAKLRVGRRLREEIRRLGAEKSEPQIGTIQPSWRGHASKKWT